MGTSILLLFLTLTAGLVAGWEKMTSPDRKKRAQGFIAVILLSMMLGIQLYRDYHTRSALESVDQFVDWEEKQIDEA